MDILYAPPLLSSQSSESLSSSWTSREFDFAIMAAPAPYQQDVNSNPGGDLPQSQPQYQYQGYTYIYPPHQVQDYTVQPQVASSSTLSYPSEQLAQLLVCTSSPQTATTNESQIWTPYERAHLLLPAQQHQHYPQPDNLTVAPQLVWTAPPTATLAPISSSFTAAASTVIPSSNVQYHYVVREPLPPAPPAQVPIVLTTVKQEPIYDPPPHPPPDYIPPPTSSIPESTEATESEEEEQDATINIDKSGMARNRRKEEVTVTTTRIKIACEMCRKRKIRCDGSRPTPETDGIPCSQCTRGGRVCDFAQTIKDYVAPKPRKKKRKYDIDEEQFRQWETLGLEGGIEGWLERLEKDIPRLEEKEVKEAEKDPLVPAVREEWDENMNLEKVEESQTKHRDDPLLNTYIAQRKAAVLSGAKRPPRSHRSFPPMPESGPPILFKDHYMYHLLDESYASKYPL
ncbi:hypothetical protein BT69DRAFT_1356426 [Atractiella rhizophila]|nr:hypothetical protein BT69DRAFT_1356426 [Atractiella rhizophila]